jgi:hypothetical protein
MFLQDHKDYSYLNKDKFDLQVLEIDQTFKGSFQNYWDLNKQRCESNKANVSHKYRPQK